MPYIILNTNDWFTEFEDDMGDGTLKQSSLGYIKNCRNEACWYNISIRQVVGERLFAKYKSFKVGLKEMSMNLRGAPPDDFQCRNYMIQLSGLPFEGNGMWSNRTKTAAGTVVLGSFLSDAPDAPVYNPQTEYHLERPSMHVFSRCDNVSLYITVLNTITYAPAYNRNGDYGGIYTLEIEGEELA